MSAVIPPYHSSPHTETPATATQPPSPPPLDPMTVQALQILANADGKGQDVFKTEAEALKSDEHGLAAKDKPIKEKDGMGEIIKKGSLGLLGGVAGGVATHLLWDKLIAPHHQDLSMNGKGVARESFAGVVEGRRTFGFTLSGNLPPSEGGFPLNGMQLVTKGNTLDGAILQHLTPGQGLYSLTLTPGSQVQDLKINDLPNVQWNTAANTLTLDASEPHWQIQADKLVADVRLNATGKAIESSTTALAARESQLQLDLKDAARFSGEWHLGGSTSRVLQVEKNLNGVVSFAETVGGVRKEITKEGLETYLQATGAGVSEAKVAAVLGKLEGLHQLQLHQLSSLPHFTEAAKPLLAEVSQGKWKAFLEGSEASLKGISGDLVQGLAKNGHGLFVACGLGIAAAVGSWKGAEAFFAWNDARKEAKSAKKATEK